MYKEIVTLKTIEIYNGNGRITKSRQMKNICTLTIFWKIQSPLLMISIWIHIQHIPYFWINKLLQSHTYQVLLYCMLNNDNKHVLLVLFPSNCLHEHGSSFKIKSTALPPSVKFTADKEHKTWEKTKDRKITFLKKICAHLNLKSCILFPSYHSWWGSYRKKKWVKVTELHCQEKPMVRDISNSQSFRH